MSKTIVLMHNNSSIYNTLHDSISNLYNCIVLKPMVSELKKIPDNITVDLFIIDLTDIAKADILYLCDKLNTKEYVTTPVIHSGSYFSHTIFTSKISALRKNKYISGPAEFNSLPNDISTVFGNDSVQENNAPSGKVSLDAILETPAIDTIPSEAQESSALISSSDATHISSDNNTESDAIQTAAVPKVSQTTSVKAPPDKKTILVIDDDVNILTTVAKYLNKEYTVISVRTTALAFMKIGIKKPDLILLDYMMPICNGMQTLEMIRNQFETSKIPVIMLTSFTEKERVLQCFELGISGYLVKPVNKEDLIDAIHKVL